MKTIWEMFFGIAAMVLLPKAGRAVGWIILGAMFLAVIVLLAFFVAWGNDVMAGGS